MNAGSRGLGTGLAACNRRHPTPHPPARRGHGTSSCLMDTFKELFVQFAGLEIWGALCGGRQLMFCLLQQNACLLLGPSWHTGRPVSQRVQKPGRPGSPRLPGMETSMRGWVWPSRPLPSPERPSGAWDTELPPHPSPEGQYLQGWGGA